ncbi:hypothetical protein FRX31_017341 [Thalictrum thalictroides]|uniref:Uncharacterized protein n=1 Tax=Thalictrum thalictroides TaxID=46969 RepID=A0A7J6WA33_THATH|nr:hypothetical protein FRX31_017341 [Thalictrum thalictroides]
MEMDSLTHSSTLSPLQSSTNAINNFSQNTSQFNQPTALINPDQISLEQMIQLLSIPSLSNKRVP